MPPRKSPPNRPSKARAAKASTAEPKRKPHEWSFLTPHALVLACLAQNPELRLREIGEAIGFTQRNVQRLVTELEETGYITRSKDGRRNVYEVDLRAGLRHPAEKAGGGTIGDLFAGLKLLARK